LGLKHGLKTEKVKKKSLNFEKKKFRLMNSMCSLKVAFVIFRRFPFLVKVVREGGGNGTGKSMFEFCSAQKARPHKDFL